MKEFKDTIEKELNENKKSMKEIINKIHEVCHFYQEVNKEDDFVSKMEKDNKEKKRITVFIVLWMIFSIGYIFFSILSEVSK